MIDPKRFHPAHDYLLVHMHLEKVERAGKLHIPGAAAESRALPLGDVLEVGPDVKQFKAGQTVLFKASEGAGLGNSEYVIIAEKACWARVDPKSVIAEHH